MNNSKAISNDLHAKSVVRSTKLPTLGFGVPVTDESLLSAIHHFTVVISHTKGQCINIYECFGAKNARQQTIHRATLSKERWECIHQTAQNIFNEQLKKRHLKTSAWQIGENVVERLLGKELCLLVWAAENIDIQQIPTVLNNWCALRPEERWWLFGEVAARTGKSEDAGKGWRLALQYALGYSAETPNRQIIKKPTSKLPSKLPSFSGDLFDKKEDIKYA